MPVSATQVAVVAALVVALGYVWAVAGRGRWRARVSDRLLYGVPWGTGVVVAVVVGFFLLFQFDPTGEEGTLMYPFVTWSYLYPTGLLTAGIAHGSVGHIASNLTATLVLAPIVEYAWSHYPRDSGRSRSGAGSVTLDEPFSVETDELRADGSGRLLDRPWVRAVVVFPAVVLLSAFLTSFFSLGPGLGFSGAVYALIGFALVTYPLSTVVAVVAASATSVLFQALTNPIVRETVEAGTPGPPSWAGIGFQAHLLGFLLGVLAAVVLLRRRGRTPSVERVFFATLAVGLAQSLWLVAWSADDVYTLYRGVGVTFVLLLTVVVAVAAAGSDRPIPRPLPEHQTIPFVKIGAGLWLLLLAVLFAINVAAAAVADVPLGVTVAGVGFLTVLLAIPGLIPFLPDRVYKGRLARRDAAVVVLGVVTLLVAAPSVPMGLIAIGPDTAPETNAVEVRDYTVAYADNATTGHAPVVDMGEEDLFAGEASGVVVVSDQRELWTVGVRPEVLEHEGNDTVVVGGLGWRETVHAERTGWNVVGNDSVYAVDLTVDEETVRSYATDPVTADARLAGHDLAVVPADDGFRLRVGAGDDAESTAVPAVGESTTVAGLTVSTVESDEVRVVVEADDARVPVAVRE